MADQEFNNVGPAGGSDQTLEPVWATGVAPAGEGLPTRPTSLNNHPAPPVTREGYRV